MRFKLVTSITATQTNQVYAVSGYSSPFTRGRECVMMVVRNAAYNAGNLQIETDNSSAGTYSDVRAAADGDGSVQQVELYNITLGDNIRVNSGTYVAGQCDIYLLGDT